VSKHWHGVNLFVVFGLVLFVSVVIRCIQHLATVPRFRQQWKFHTALHSTSTRPIRSVQVMLCVLFPVSSVSHNQVSKWSGLFVCSEKASVIRHCRMTNFELLRWLVETPSRDVEHYHMSVASRSPRLTLKCQSDIWHYNVKRGGVTWRSLNANVRYIYVVLVYVSLDFFVFSASYCKFFIKYSLNLLICAIFQ